MSLNCCKVSSIAWFMGGFLLLAGGTLAALYFLGVFAPPKTIARPGDSGTSSERERVPVPVVRFTDITKAAVLRFFHNTGATEKKLLPETMCGGVAILDFDNDGKPDVLFINACPWPGQEKSSDQKPTLTLYHNEGGG